MLNTKDLKRIDKLKSQNSELDYLFTALEKDHHDTISVISHELRNTLTLVISSLQYMESCHKEIKEFKYWPETMSDLAYMKDLLVNLSDFNNSQSIKLEPLDIKSFVEHIYRTYLPISEGNKKSFTLTCCTDRPSIMADKIKLQQALVNLLKNAFDAIGEEGMITLDLKSLTDSVTITITDNGLGITKEQMADIFTPFTTFKPNGSGLGLPITKNIIERHKGSIKVSSNSVQGTAFLINLPKSLPLA